jgi:hypothetical protein
MAESVRCCDVRRILEAWRSVDCRYWLMLIKKNLNLIGLFGWHAVNRNIPVNPRRNHGRHFC